MKDDRYFGPGLFTFLKQLRSHNDRDWFQRNKARYEADVRDPMLRLIGDLRPGLYKISPYFVADPSPSRGSMMRIYRDIRFSSDKSPYKTNAAAQFWHEKGSDGATPGFYLHLQPQKSFFGGGLWRPEPDALRKIRGAIAADPKRWKQATSAKQLGAGCTTGGESLQRPPRGYDPDHPLIADIKRKDFVVGCPLSDREVRGRGLRDLLLQRFRATWPYMHFLSRALGLP